MKNKLLNYIKMIAIITALLWLVSGLDSVAAGLPITPQSTANKKTRNVEKTVLTAKSAAKREMVRLRQEQRITNDQRRAAAEALKAERLKVYKAKQETQQ